MMPNTILSFVRESESLDDAKRAIALARDSGCYLSFAVIGVPLPPAAVVAYAAPSDVWLEERDRIQTSIATKAEALETMLQEAEISGDVSQHSVISGGVASLVGLRARYVDLAIIFGKTEENERLRRDALRGLTFEGGIPFLVAPRNRPLSLRPERIVVAWDGSLEATRAVHAALDILVSAKSVSITMVDPREIEWQSGEEPGFDIASFLARHGVRAEVDRLASGGKFVSKVIIRHARDRNAGLVVMGAYGHSRLREYVFGGTTLEMLNQTDIPVLMTH